MADEEENDEKSVSESPPSESNDYVPVSETPATGPSEVKNKSDDYIVNGNKKIRSG